MRIGLAGVGRIGAFHAGTLCQLPAVDSVIVTDADPARARAVAGQLGAEAAQTADELLDSGLDALVVATATDAHPEFIVRGIKAGLPVFCEKPVAADISGTLEVIAQAAAGHAPVQIGFQRRFDAGYAAARAAVRSGRLGWLHTLRATTLDPAPPPPGYVASSGGLFRDCSVHDFDIIRWVTGREVSEVYALGTNRGADFFREAGDVDTMAAVLTLDDGTIALVSNTRYNAAGYDVRLEVLGSAGSIGAGLDDRLPLPSAEPGAAFPAGPAYANFVDRFSAAYRAELAAFVHLAAEGGPSPCTMADALEAFYVAEACELSRARHVPVAVAEVRQ
ncbi:MAG TPA: Gfo/Idh/MocA family oxidoreductase [Streptosporangiaceae bacterium]|nr:Gfo/Idh/MocA family oxidoreductase [Streptosporangiaceae bacterium]